MAIATLFRGTILDNFYRICFGLFLLVPVCVAPFFYYAPQSSEFFLLLMSVDVLFVVFFAAQQWNIVSSVFRLKLIQAFAAYIIIIAIVSLFGVDPIHSLLGDTVRMTGWVLLAHVFLAVCLFGSMVNGKRAEYLVYGFVSVATFISIYGIFEFFGWVHSFGVSFLPRISSLIGNPAHLASYLVYPFMFSVLYTLKQHAYRKWFLFSTCIIFIALVLTGTRGAILGVVVGALASLILLVFFTMKKKWYGFAFMGVVLVGVLGMFSLFRTLPADSSYVRFFTSRNETISTRLQYWRSAIDGFKTHPWIGVGYENFYVDGDRFYQPSVYLFEEEFVDKPHNAYLEILATTGLFGFAGYMVFISFVFYHLVFLFRQKKITRIDLAVFIGGVVAFEFQSLFLFHTVISWFSLAVMLIYLVGKSHVEQSPLVELFRRSSRDIRIWGSVLFLVFVFWFFVFLRPLMRFFVLMQSPATVAPTVELQRLNSAENLLFVFDDYMLGNQYDYYAQQLLTQKTVDMNLYNAYIQKAVYYYKRATVLHPHRALYWKRLANTVLNAGKDVELLSDVELEMAIRKVIELAPNRADKYILESRRLMQQNALDAALKVLLDQYSSMEKSATYNWALASVYLQKEDYQQVAVFMYEGLVRGIRLTDSSTFLWLVDYYGAQQAYEKVIFVLLKAIEISRDASDLYPKLAAAYAANGQTDQAIITAKKYLELVPSAAAEVEQFIRTVQK